jgi:hypothetical protein
MMSFEARCKNFTRVACLLILCSSVQSLKLGESSPVSVTFYEEFPNMACSTGNGACGCGTDVTGNTDFVKTSLYPIHAASGNYEILGGCGACGTLSYNGLARSFVITNIIDRLNSIGGDGLHIDLCGIDFSYFQSLKVNGQLDFSHGGIFTSNWTRVPCETLGYPDYPDGPKGQHAIRTQAYNQWAKALILSRMHGVGEIKQIDFMTRSGGYYTGQRIQGWGAWWTPGQDLLGQGGVGLKVALADDSVVLLDNYPLPECSTWNTSNLFMVGP